MPSRKLLELFLEQAGNRPDSCALVFGDEHISYHRLLDLALELRSAMAELRVSTGRPVCVPAVKTPETVGLLLACLMDRRQVLLPSPELGQDVLRLLCQQSSCAHVLAAERSAEGPAVLGIRSVPASAEAAAGFVLPAPDEAMLFLTTSGSTGTPKIVPIGTEAADRFLSWSAEQFELGADTAVLSYAPLNFDLSLLDVWAPLRVGGRVVLVDQSRATDSTYLAELLETHPVHLVQAVPMFYRLLADGGRGDERPYKSVAHVVFTGDAMPHGLLVRLPEVFPSARLHNIFGCTETNDSFRHEVVVEELAPDERIPIGRPLPGVDAIVVGPDGKPLDGECTGELLVSTPFQTTGYLQARRNEGVFAAHPDGGTGRTYYRTGDIVTRRADGVHLLEGRDDFYVKVRGVRTNVQEIEQVILGHPEVRDAAVVALPDELAGARLYAVVQREPGSSLNGLTLRTHCARLLPRPSIPATVVVADDSLPRTPTGKPDRNLIKQRRMEMETTVS
ncbi:AMP-binding protein [Kitasatospora sp. GP82]|uniref:AMP-binding protein n=1 Tax=Kitasatospora sp. GP82 TaxID=3035089 RepID=UPI002476BA0F|nr:AMP-binding protein [Kitasatospora sp. GP82]MDH6128149.1 acyl-coenzyme A synthetase/AMP-(fatty) acid ligase [Kitasatospora sp. GP82]